MRKPSDRAALWAWWRRHQGTRPADVPADPQCGLFKVRTKDRSWMAAAIDLLQPIDPDTGELWADEKLIAFVNAGGRQWDRDPHEAWPFLAKHPVTEADHFRLLHAPRVTDLSRSVIT